MLSALGIDPARLRYVQPRTRRSHWQAIVNWLTRYQPPAEGANLEQVRGYLEAFHHLCQIEEWQRALSLMLHELDTPAQTPLHYQLKLWGYLPEQKELYDALVDHVEPLWQGRLLQFLGTVHQAQGNYRQAQDYCDRSLAILQTVGDPVDQGMVLSHLGDIHYALGDYGAAIDYQQQWLAIAREAGLRSGEGIALGSLGNVYDQMGDYAQAITYHTQDLAIARCLGEKQGEAAALVNLANAHDELGHQQQAIELYHQALAIARQIGDRWGEGLTLANLGETLVKVGQHETALVYLQTALKILQRQDARAIEAATYKWLGVLYQAMDDRQQATAAFDRAIALATALEIPLADDCRRLRSTLSV